MANMDYPGPCTGCSGIDGCSNESAKQEAVDHYCKGLEMELNSWKTRLYDVLAYDNPAGFGDTLNLIKSTIKELENTMEEMRGTCPSSLSDKEKEVAGKLENLRTHYTKAMEVISPGWFGG